MWGLHLLLNCGLLQLILMASFYSNSCLTISGVFSRRGFAISQFHSKSFVVKQFPVGCKKIVKAVLSCLRQLRPRARIQSSQEVPHTLFVAKGSQFFPFSSSSVKHLHTWIVIVGRCCQGEGLLGPWELWLRILPATFWSWYRPDSSAITIKASLSNILLVALVIHLKPSQSRLVIHKINLRQRWGPRIWRLYLRWDGTIYWSL